MIIVSWNLLHNCGASLDQVISLIRQEQPDLMLMQETTAYIDRLPDRIGGYYARTPLPGRSHGLAAWSPRPFEEQPRSLPLQPGMFVRRVCQLVTQGGIAFANVHLSHGQVMNRRQLRRIVEHLPQRAAIVGDCNMVGPPLLPGFRDVGARQATHALVEMLPLRLDRCLARGLSCTEGLVLARIGSDHHPIVVGLTPL